MDACFLCARFSRRLFYIFGLNTFLLIALLEKEKASDEYSMTHREEIKEVEGKKSSFEDRIVNFFSEEIYKASISKNHASVRLSVKF